MKQIKEVGLKFDLVANVKDKNIKDLEKRAEKLAKHYESVIKKTNDIKQKIDSARNAQKFMNTVSIQYGTILSKNLDTIQKIAKSTKNIKPIEVKSFQLSGKAQSSYTSSSYTKDIPSRAGDDKIYANAMEMNRKYDLKKSAKEENSKLKSYEKLFDQADKKEESSRREKLKQLATAMEMNRKYDQTKMKEENSLLEKMIKEEETILNKRIREEDKILNKMIKEESDKFKQLATAMEMNKKFNEKRAKEEEKLIESRAKMYATALEMNKKFDLKRTDEHGKALEMDKKFEQNKIDEHGKALEMNKKFEEKRVREEERLIEERSKMYAKAFEMNKKYDEKISETRAKEHGQALELNKRYDEKRADEHGKAIEMNKKLDLKRMDEHGKALEMDKKFEQDKVDEHGKALEMNKKFDEKRVREEEKLIEDRAKMYAKAFEMNKKYDENIAKKRSSEHGQAIEMNKRFDAKLEADRIRAKEKEIKLSGRLANKFSMLDHAASLVERTFNSISNVGEKLAEAETLRRQGETIESKFGNVFKEEIEMLKKREGLTKGQVLGEVAIIMGRMKTSGLSDEKSVEATKKVFEAARYITATQRGKTIVNSLDSMTNVIDGQTTALDNIGVDLSKKEAEKGATDPQQAMMNRVDSVVAYLSRNPLVKMAEKEGTLRQEINKMKNTYTTAISKIESNFNPVLKRIAEGINDFFYRFMEDPILMNAIKRFAETIDLAIKGFNKLYVIMRPLFWAFEKIFYITVFVSSLKLAVTAIKKMAEYFLSFGGLFKISSGNKMGIPVRVVNANEISGSGGGLGNKGGLLSLGSKAGGFIMRKVLPFIMSLGPMIMTALTTMLPFLPAILAVGGAGFLLWKAYKNSKKDEEIKDVSKKDEGINEKKTSFKFIEADLKAQSLERYKNGVNARFGEDLGIVGKKSGGNIGGANGGNVTIENNITVTGSENTNKDVATILEKTNRKNAMQLNDSMAMGGV